jgi:hypothetical protein
VVLQLILLEAHAKEVYEIELRNLCHYDEVFFDAPSLAHLVEQCPNLKTLTLFGLKSLQEDHVRVLGALSSRPGLDIELNHCRITGAAAEALVEVLLGRRNQGPTKLDSCDMDCSVLAHALRGNSRLQSLAPHLSYNSAVRNQELLAIAGALGENKGLVELDLKHQLGMSNETWDAVCDSLQTHPTLQVLNLWSMQVFGGTPSASAVLKSRIQALVDMVQVNTSIHTILLPNHYSEHEMFRTSVIPYLEANRFRPRVLDDHNDGWILL